MTKLAKTVRVLHNPTIVVIDIRRAFVSEDLVAIGSPVYLDSNGCLTTEGQNPIGVVLGIRDSIATINFSCPIDVVYDEVTAFNGGLIAELSVYDLNKPNLNKPIGWNWNDDEPQILNEQPIGKVKKTDPLEDLLELELGED